MNHLLAVALSSGVLLSVKIGNPCGDAPRVVVGPPFVAGSLLGIHLPRLGNSPHLGNSPRLGSCRFRHGSYPRGSCSSSRLRARLGTRHASSVDRTCHSHRHHHRRRGVRHRSRHGPCYSRHRRRRDLPLRGLPHIRPSRTLRSKPWARASPCSTCRSR